MILAVIPIPIKIHKKTYYTGIFVSNSKTVVSTVLPGKSVSIPDINHNVDFLTVPKYFTFPWFKSGTGLIAGSVTHTAQGYAWYSPITQGGITLTAGLHFNSGLSGDSTYGIIIAQDASLAPSPHYHPLAPSPPPMRTQSSFLASIGTSSTTATGPSTNFIFSVPPGLQGQTIGTATQTFNGGDVIPGKTSSFNVTPGTPQDLALGSLPYDAGMSNNFGNRTLTGTLTIQASNNMTIFSMNFTITASWGSYNTWDRALSANSATITITYGYATVSYDSANNQFVIQISVGPGPGPRYPVSI